MGDVFASTLRAFSTMADVFGPTMSAISAIGQRLLRSSATRQERPRVPIRRRGTAEPDCQIRRKMPVHIARPAIFAAGSSPAKSSIPAHASRSAIPARGRAQTRSGGRPDFGQSGETRLKFLLVSWLPARDRIPRPRNPPRIRSQHARQAHLPRPPAGRSRR
jgi:hypothetical protein